MCTTSAFPRKQLIVAPAKLLVLKPLSPTFAQARQTVKFRTGCYRNPNLRPERARGFEGGLLWSPGRRFESEVTIFERRDRDVIDYVRASASAPYMAENIQKLDFTGVEASVELRLPSDGRL